MHPRTCRRSIRWHRNTTQLLCNADLKRVTQHLTCAYVFSLIVPTHRSYCFATSQRTYSHKQQRTSGLLGLGIRLKDRHTATMRINLPLVRMLKLAELAGCS